MKQVASTILLSVSLCCGAAETFTTYENIRFGFLVDYPKNLLIPQGEAENGDGQIFISRTGDAKLTVYGSNRRKELDHMCHALFGVKDPNSPNITYKVSNKNYSVASGYRDGKVFYTKAVVTKDRCLMLDLEYKIESREVYDTITSRIANSLKG